MRFLALFALFTGVHARLKTGTNIASSDGKAMKYSLEKYSLKSSSDGIDYDQGKGSVETTKCKGRHCSTTPLPPSRCPHAAFCASRYFNGKCDAICNNNECLLDGFDCSYEEGDMGRINASIITIEFAVQYKPSIFVAVADYFMNDLSEKFKTAVQFKMTEGQRDVFNWNSATGIGSRVPFGRTDANVNRAWRYSNGETLSGVLVRTQIKLADCSRECFTALFYEFSDSTKPETPLNHEQEESSEDYPTSNTTTESDYPTSKNTIVSDYPSYEDQEYMLV